MEATRSSEGFLKRLFEEEIHEIYDGTVVIKSIARQAGVRSKVAVASVNEDVDATGACIGQGGSRIQKIVQQLGNGKIKEKIDVVNYSPNPGVFIIEACRPVSVIGVLIDEENKTADVIINDGDLPVGLGKKQANLKLASKLTGYNIEMVEKSKAEKFGIEYIPSEEWIKKAEEERRQREKEAYIKKAEEEAARRAKEEEEKRLAEEEEARKALEEKQLQEKASKDASKEEIPTPKVAPKASATPDMFPAEAINPAKAALAQVMAQKKAEEEAAKKASENKESVTQTIEVKTTTSLDDLEKELESAKEKKTKSGSKMKRPRKITEDEVKREVSKPTIPTMPVYTDEELSQIEEEENSDYDDLDSDEDIDEDYSEYDQYYDDDGK
ncbi:MAG TPA: hypothetical protein DD377_06100 [Firmicutes bacterium]|nr:hypothetical protein [Bacillota bacterium]